MRTPDRQMTPVPRELAGYTLVDLDNRDTPRLSAVSLYRAGRAIPRSVIEALPVMACPDTVQVSWKNDPHFVAIGQLYPPREHNWARDGEERDSRFLRRADKRYTPDAGFRAQAAMEILVYHPRGSGLEVWAFLGVSTSPVLNLEQNAERPEWVLNQGLPPINCKDLPILWQPAR